LQEFSLKIYLS